MILSPMRLSQLIYSYLLMQQVLHLFQRIAQLCASTFSIILRWNSYSYILKIKNAMVGQFAYFSMQSECFK